MVNNAKDQPGLPEGAPHEAPGGETGGKPPKRFSAKRKMEIVLRHLRGESLELLSRECQLPAAHISKWHDDFLRSGGEALKKQPKDEPELTRLNAKIGEQAMEIELLREKIARMENGQPLQRRRSRR